MTTTYNYFWGFILTNIGAPSATQYWSTQSRFLLSHQYTAKILPDSFSGIKINDGGESRVHTLEDFSFTIKKETTDTFIEFQFLGKDYDLLILDATAEAIKKRFRFRVKSIDISYGLWTFHCEDALVHSCLNYTTDKSTNSNFPTFLTTKTLWNSDIIIPDNICPPVVFGTAFIPVYLIKDSSGDLYYICDVGTGVGKTFYELRSPRDFGSNSIWDAEDYTFTGCLVTSTKSPFNYAGVQPLIADGAFGIFSPNDAALPPLLQFDGSVYVDPGDIIKYILGLGEVFITAASATFATWGLTFKGAFYEQKTLGEYLSSLLKQCHSVLAPYGTTSSTYWKIKTLSKTSVLTVDNTKIIDGSFKSSKTESSQYDAGIVAFPGTGEPQDLLYQTLVRTGSTYSNDSDEILETPYVDDSQMAQKLGILYYQRKYGIDKSISFDSTPVCINVECGDIITISGALYNADTPYIACVRSINITQDFKMSFDADTFVHTLDDWGDLTPDAIVPEVASLVAPYTTLRIGPTTTTTAGNPPNKKEGAVYLERVGAYDSSGLELTDQSGYGPKVNDGGIVTNAYQSTAIITLSAQSSAIVPGTPLKVPFNTAIINIGSDFDLVNYQYTAPVDCRILISGEISLADLDTGADYYGISIVTSNRTTNLGLIDPKRFSADVSYWPIPFSIIANMDANDTCYVEVAQVGGTQQTVVRMGPNTNINITILN